MNPSKDRCSLIEIKILCDHSFNGNTIKFRVKNKHKNIKRKKKKKKYTLRGINYIKKLKQTTMYKLHGISS